MRLEVEFEQGLYRLWVVEQGVRRPLLLPGDLPSWAGGWAGLDGVGRYDHGRALGALHAFGLAMEVAERMLQRADRRR